jgi:putative two-component system response regulator
MTDLRPCRGTILIVDDQENNVRILERMLRKAGYEQLASSTDPRDAQPLFEQHQPDLVLLDLHMPYLDGFGVLARLAPHIAPRAPTCPSWC